MRRSIALLGYFVLAAPQAAAAQTAQPSAIAFVNVNVVPLTEERVDARQTVLVREGRIEHVGPADAVAVPADALVIDGSRRYLMPGLTDAHVHLDMGMPWAPTRPNFGDGPLYLAHGVTTVVNLAGSEATLEWRRRVENAELIGPTIYTSGPFVNEPRVTTPDEVERDVVAQSSRGYDLIKFHELPGTTVGLSTDSYRRMIDTARRTRTPLVGHAPVNLGLDEMLAAHQDIAHLGMLLNVYFLPMSSHPRLLLATLVAAVALVLTALIAVVHLIFRRTKNPRANGDPANRLARKLSASTGLATIAAAFVATAFLPGGPLFDSTALRLLFTVLAAVIVILSALACAQVVFRIRGTRVSGFGRFHAVVGGASSAVLAFTLVTFWVPIAWRSSDSGIKAMAKRMKAAGISVQSTLVVYESLGATARARLIDEPVVNALSAETRERWRGVVRANPGMPMLELAGFMQHLAGALHREGVPIVAGTDAMGIELIAPGRSLHDELRLLLLGGLSRYEVLRSATTRPAAFLGKSEEFGTIAAGQRADLLLVRDNPLDSLTTLEQPEGVMTRGRWHPRSELDALVQQLSSQ